MVGFGEQWRSPVTLFQGRAPTQTILSGLGVHALQVDAAGQQLQLGVPSI
jgi:hypothetical protein